MNEARTFRVHTVISGGQTGVDRAALDAAVALGIPIAGWIPAGRKAEDGIVPMHYTGLAECQSSHYPVRTRLNVRDADATLVFTAGTPHGGTALTLRIVESLSKPLLVVDALYHHECEAVQHVGTWLDSLRVTSLNVAGPRASQLPLLYDYTRSVLEHALVKTGGANPG